MMICPLDVNYQFSFVFSYIFVLSRYIEVFRSSTMEMKSAVGPRRMRDPPHGGSAYGNRPAPYDTSNRFGGANRFNGNGGGGRGGGGGGGGRGGGGGGPMGGGRNDRAALFDRPMGMGMMGSGAGKMGPSDVRPRG